MSESKKTAKTAKKTKKKPLRRAEKWTKETPRMMRKILLQMIVVVVMGMLFSALQGIENYALRLVLSVGVIAAMLAMIFVDGMTKGTEDAASSRTYMQLAADGHPLSDKDDAACYHPLKAVTAAAMAFVIPMALAVIMALNAREYTYTLQSVPTWLSVTYGSRSDIMAPLAAYEQTAGLSALDAIRVIVRLFEMIFINLFPDPQKMTALIDRLSPLMLVSYPIAYVAGYLLGPGNQEKIVRQNRRAKKVAVRRAERSKVAAELLGAQSNVHYGHKKEEKARKKKELI